MLTKERLLILILFIGLALSSGCTYLIGPEEGGVTSPAGSTTPYVVFTNPSNGMANVQRTGSFMVQAEFSMEMNPGSVNFMMITGGAPVSGSIYWVGYKMLQFIPHTILMPNTTYECIITAGRSSSGFPLTPLPLTWKFTTGF